MTVKSKETVKKENQSDCPPNHVPVMSLPQGDFLSPESQAIIRSCNIIFCNNYTFPSELNLQLKTIFEDLPDGMWGLSIEATTHPRC